MEDQFPTNSSFILESMFNEYKLVDLTEIATYSSEKKVCFEGYLRDFILGDALNEEIQRLEQLVDNLPNAKSWLETVTYRGGFIDIMDHELAGTKETSVMLRYDRQIGLSQKQLIKLLENDLKDKKIKIYGEVIKGPNDKNEIELHGIEFMDIEDKVTYPKSDWIKDKQLEDKFPDMLDWITYQGYQKKFNRVLADLKDPIEIEKIEQAYAELEFYRAYIDAEYELGQKIRKQIKIELVSNDDPTEEISNIVNDL